VIVVLQRQCLKRARYAFKNKTFCVPIPTLITKLINIRVPNVGFLFAALKLKVCRVGNICPMETVQISLKLNFQAMCQDTSSKYLLPSLCLPRVTRTSSRRECSASRLKGS
jgi:hypothetical protein